MENAKMANGVQFKINECVSRLTSLYAVPFTCKLYYT